MIARFFRFVIPALMLATISTVAKADIIYGSTSTSLFRINTATNAQDLLVTTAFTNINGLAFDAANNRLYYRAGSGNAQGAGVFRFYDINGGAQGTITPLTSFGGAATNASFFNGNYWFVRQQSTTLVRFNPSTGVVTEFNPFVTTPTQPTFDFFGDIAISSGGILYGADQTRFFRVNISTVVPSGFAVISSGTSNNTNQYSRQLAFGADGQTLFGYKNTSRPWVTVDLVSGATPASPPLTNLNQFADLASAAVIPEPGSILLTLCGGGIMLGLVARRRRE
ncbi:MAG: PEP-CTERM sorting domain-containing protein [Fibrella sp.]|nr:PEP-CTERM sorting domain-containing protein [Armatimonadota bacterium]